MYIVDPDDWKPGKKEDEQDRKILLPSKNPEHYVADLLCKILPRLMNPEGEVVHSMIIKMLS